LKTTNLKLKNVRVLHGQFHEIVHDCFLHQTSPTPINKQRIELARVGMKNNYPIFAKARIQEKFRKVSQK
jgi:hypothetical protein